MFHKQMKQSVRFSSAIVSGALLIASAASAHAQAFANLKSGLIDYSQSANKPRKTCEAIGKFKSKEIAEIKSASIAASVGVPAHCRITGVITPEVAFEVSLPDNWNGRFYMIGNGGHAGESLEDAGRVSQRNAALQVGFAFAQTNTGHDSRKEVGASFVMSNAQKAIDYAYRAVHVTAITAKDITKEYYGKAVSKSYWNSCSNGGRQGAMEAQRFPEDFDGIIANAPWVDQTGFTIGAMWNQKALSAAPLNAGKVATLAASVMAKCDELDGLKDNLIDDPRKCNFNAAVDVPACKPGADTNDCLTPAQAEAIMKIYQGPTSNGKPFFTGYMPGSEANWMGVLVPANPTAKAADFNLAEGTMRYLVPTPPKPDYDYITFNYDTDINQLDEWSKKADAKNPDLSKFRKRGGKLLMTYGWADPILQPMMGVKYFEAAVAENGAGTTDFFRLFMVPGMSHCAGGIGPDQVDPVTAVVNWVEKGSAPSSLIASKIVAGKVTRTRPLCSYPQVARYSGAGSIDDASNFSCRMP
ncbi:MAG: tannase/feruloyl esterase family alpha/beta hydrolase [Acidobacteriota bacterium]